MILWKVDCMEDRFPGLWHRLYRHQCVAIGWPPWRKRKKTKKKSPGLAKARKALSRIRPPTPHTPNRPPLMKRYRYSGA